MIMTAHRFDWRGFVLWIALGFAAVAALSGCAGNRFEPPKTVEVAIPVPVECRIEQVPVAEKPTYRSTDGIFELTKKLLAEREVRTAETDRLRAANTSPCPVNP